MTAATPDAGRASATTQREARRLILWLLVPILGLLAVLSALQFQQGLRDAEAALNRRADERAQDLLALARPAIAHVHDMRRMLEEAWHEPPPAPVELRSALKPWRPVPPTDSSPPDGWTLDEAPPDLRQRHGQLWWGSRNGDAPSDLWLGRFALLQRGARVANERSPGFEGSYFVSVERNVSWSYPWFDTPQMLGAMGVRSLKELDELRILSFSNALQQLTPERQRNGWWGQAYVSQIHGRLVQSHLAAVMVGGQYQGEVSVDFRLDTLQDVVTRWSDPASRIWVVDRRLRVVADSTEPLQAPGEVGVANEVVEVPVAQRLPAALASQLIPHLNSTAAVTMAHVDGWVVLSAARAESPWIYLQLVPAETLRRQVALTLVPNALIGLALLAVFLWGQWLFTRWFVNPSLAVLAYLRELGSNPTAAPPQLGPRWQGWIRAVHNTIREQQQQREQIERQREALRRSERLSTMGTMLASVAHELNNPLAIAMGRAALLEERVLAATDAASPAAWAVRDDARRVREASERCARIVTSFLDFARQRPPSRRTVALAEVVRTATDLVGHRLRSQGVQLELALPDDLPTVVADFDHLVQVLLNLLLNAQQAMEGQAGERRIRVAAGVCSGSGETEPARVVWLAVEDTGPGVPDALRERLFEPFFTTKEGGQGTGLGLSISRGLLQEHGGSLQLESTRPGATCFRLTLPLVRPTTEPAAARVPPPAATDDAVSLPPADTAALARVLVVDDDPDMAELVLATLETAGYEVAIAESGSVALELLAEARFDAVVGTLHLPDLDALALQQALLERQPALATRSLYLTGDALSERVAQLLRQLGRPHLEKPFTRAALLQAVRQLVAG